MISGVLDSSPTNHLPVYAILKGKVERPKIKIDKQETSQYIDDRKKDEFLNILKYKLSLIDLNEHPEAILAALTEATQAAINICFPLKMKSNRAKKRSLTPWFDTDIFKDEKTQSRLFRRFIKSKNADDYKAYNTFQKKLSKKKYRTKRAYFEDILIEAKNSENRKATSNIINMALGRKKKKKVVIQRK